MWIRCVERCDFNQANQGLLYYACAGQNHTLWCSLFIKKYTYNICFHFLTSFDWHKIYHLLVTDGYERLTYLLKEHTQCPLKIASSLIPP